MFGGKMLMQEPVAAPSSGFDPTLYPGLIADWDASALVGYTDGQLVPTFTDTTGTKSATAVSGEQAIYKTAIQNGLPVLRFPGPYLQTTYAFTRASNIRTVYWVIKEDALTASSTSRFLLGDGASYHFHRSITGDGAMWSAIYASVNVRSGETRLDGGVVDGTLTPPPKGSFGVISLVTTGNVSASQITEDRAYGNSSAGRYWFGDIAQIIIYSAVHSAADVAAINAGLKAKWGTP